ncbi:alpha/beta fold hydrolase [Rhizobium oryzicola]|uniref:Alpha/beta hydrolase n=1 Tax=Rhizobium oryzicola TaxID=1232668 RepID=A0ABT8STP7_9HYPH|nr:alpha/beta hydrolase [Rhizobium oryzicola]MDO1581273.1 alpha/beta hydrolase [Rhizobium oryzicola]
MPNPDHPRHVGQEFLTRSDFWGVFQHANVQINGVNLHYVEGGEGAPVLLIPGWPQSWYAWRYVMADLVKAGRRVIAIDPRGMGDSDAPLDGYDLTTVAAEIHAFVRALGLIDKGPIDVAGHDVGAWIGYAYASDWAEDIRRIALMDALVPGLSSPRTDLPPEEIALRSWHFAFNRLNDLPEILIAGREEVFLTWLFRAKAMNASAIAAEDIALYARQLSGPGMLRAAGSYYRAAFSTQALAVNRKRAETKLEMPVLALGAERGVGDMMLKTFQGLATHVEGGTINGAGHYLPEEAGPRIARELLSFFETKSV